MVIGSLMNSEKNYTRFLISYARTAALAELGESISVVRRHRNSL